MMTLDNSDASVGRFFKISSLELRKNESPIARTMSKYKFMIRKILNEGVAHLLTIL